MVNMTYLYVLRLTQHVPHLPLPLLFLQIIVGNSEFTGILNDLFPGLSDPLPWYLSRTALITWITLASAPLLSAKSLHGMALTSAISVGSTILSVVALVVLALIAAYQGNLKERHTYI